MSRARLLIVFSAVLLLPRSALAHTARQIAPHDLWSAWTLNAFIVVPLLLTISLYFAGLRSIHRSSGRLPDGWTARAASFAGGWLLLVLALVSPLHALGETLFSAHMVQHELLMTLAAPLLVLSRPVPIFLWSLPTGWRRRVSDAVIDITRPVSLAFTPLGAFGVHGAAIWIWHAPPLYNATLTSDVVHSAQHLSFILTALLFWWTIFPVGRERHQGSALLSLFATAVHTSVLGALLTFSGTIWYHAYGAAPALWGMTPLEDQQLGGLIMWIPGGLAYLVAALWSAARMLSVSEARALRTAAAVAMVAFLGACKPKYESNETLITSADAAHGKALIRKYGCPACHVIPGVPGANGLVGPPLAGVASRAYLAGVLPNSPGNMEVWLQHPQQVDKLTVMPDMGVTPGDAQDIAAYLYTLK